MKILYHHRIRSKDGQFVHLMELVGALRRLGHEVVISGPGDIENEAFGTDSASVSFLKRRVSKPIYELLELGYSIPDALRLMSAARRVKPDVIYERYNLFCPSGVWTKRLLGIPLLLEINAPLYEERNRFGGIWATRLAEWSENFVWTQADAALPVTEVLAQKVRARGTAPSRITVIQNGIDESVFKTLPSKTEAQAKLGLEGTLVLGFVGFMRDWHGLDRVLRFMAAHPDRNMHAVFVGDGPDRSRLEAIACDVGITDRLTMTGVLQRHDIPAAIAAFDVALQPDVVEYASPLKLFEYMAAGSAIVAPDTSNIREVLRHSHDALLFDRADQNDFIRSVERLCFDDDLREALGKNAKTTIVNRRLTWTANAERVIDIASRMKRRNAINKPASH
jgi:glycosyltransferase involved in cell wall biosynthesis